MMESAGLVVRIGILCPNKQIKFPSDESGFVLTGKPKWVRTVEPILSLFHLRGSHIALERCNSSNMAVTILAMLGNACELRGPLLKISAATVFFFRSDRLDGTRIRFGPVPFQRSFP
jgi:hypothetical protein